MFDSEMHLVGKKRPAPAQSLHPILAAGAIAVSLDLVGNSFGVQIPVAIIAGVLLGWLLRGQYHGSPCAECVAQASPIARGRASWVQQSEPRSRSAP